MTEVVWSFETKRFRVALEIDPEDIDPAEHFDDPEDVENIRNGNVEWFQAAVVVYFKPTDGSRSIQIGFDALGACAYNTVQEFYTSHRDPNPMNRNCSIMRARRGDVNIGHYFPDMVRQAIEQARGHVEAMRLT